MRPTAARDPVPEHVRVPHSPGAGPVPDTAPYTTLDRPADPTGDSGWADPGWMDPDWVDPLRADPIRRAVVDRLAIAGRRHPRHRAERSVRAGRPGPHA